MKHTVSIDKNKCIGCGLCREDCPQNNIGIEGGKACVLEPDCMMCGHCSAVCPKGAVSISGYPEPPVALDKAVVLDPDHFLLSIKARRSVRKFLPKEVPAEVIGQIIEAGRYTPTAKNAQDVVYSVLREGRGAAERKAIRMFRRLRPFAALFMRAARSVAIDDNFFFKGAPVVIVISAKQKIDGHLAAQSMAAMAEASGLGVLYSGFYTVAANVSGKLRKLSGLRRGQKVAATLVIGYPAVKYARTAQREPAAVRYL